MLLVLAGLSLTELSLDPASREPTRERVASLRDLENVRVKAAFRMPARLV